MVSKTNLLPMVADRLLNTPLLLDPRKAQVIYGVLQGRIAPDISVELPNFDPEADNSHLPAPLANGFVGTRYRKEGDRSLVRRVDSVAIVDVHGSLVNRGAWLNSNSGLTSYEGIGAQVDAARVDPEIASVILDIDSPGGEAAGMFGIAEKVRQLAAVKQVIAVVNDIACSAAYGIASGATEIVISPISLTGSIGAVMVHADHSGQLENAGIKPTILQKGAQKTYGHPFGALEPEAFAALDKILSVLYEQFLGTIAMGRGSRLSADAARKTEARIFIGEDAIAAGIADRVGTFNEVLAQLQTQGPMATTTETVDMTTQTPTNTPAGAAPVAAPARSYSQAEFDAAVAAAEIKGGNDARDRVKAITGHADAAGRQKAALTMATDNGIATMGVDSIAAMLANFPKEAVAEAKAEAKTEDNVIPGPGQRAEGAVELGPDDSKGSQGKAESKDHGWGEVMAEVNAGR